MTAEETAIVLTVLSGAAVKLTKPILALIAPGRRWRSNTVEPLALAATAAGVLAWHAAQPGPQDWRMILPPLALGWGLASGAKKAAKKTAKAKPKKEAPPMS